MAEDEERLRRLTRLFQWNTVKRATVISQIRSIHDMGVRVRSENSLAFVYSFHVADLDSLWHEFQSFDFTVLNCLYEMNRADEYSRALHSSMRELVDVSKTVLAQIGTTNEELVASSRIIGKAHPTTCESNPCTSTTILGPGTSFPSGRFSEVLSSCKSEFDTTLAISRPTVVQSLDRVKMSDCNVLVYKLPLAKLISVFGPVFISPNFVRSCIYDLFRDRQFPPYGICATHDASGANERSLTCVLSPAVIKLVCAPSSSSPPPPVLPLHSVVYRQPAMFLRNKNRCRFAFPPLSVYYIPVRRRFRYAWSLSSLHLWVGMKSLVFWVIGPHESFKKYVFSRGNHVCTLLGTDCLWHYGKS